MSKYPPAHGRLRFAKRSIDVGQKVKTVSIGKLTGRLARPGCHSLLGRHPIRERSRANAPPLGVEPQHNKDRGDDIADKVGRGRQYSLPKGTLKA